MRLPPPSIVLATAFVVAVVAAGAGQTRSTPTTISPALRRHLSAERLQPVTSVRGLPLGVREELERMFGTSATAIADPGSPFQATDDISDPSLPIRRLDVAGCSQDHCLVYYERGGYAHLWFVALFHWTPNETRLEGGGQASRGMSTIDEVRTALLTGAVKGPVRSW